MGTCGMGARGLPRSAGYMHMTTPFTSTPITGPTYTDLAHEVDRLKADNAALLQFIGTVMKAEQPWAWIVDRATKLVCAPTPHPGSALLDELENLRKQVEALKAGQRNASEASQRAFLELAEDLAEMEPADRDSAIKRIIDNAGENRP